MEIIKQVLLSLTDKVYNFTAAPGTAPPFIVWQMDGENVLTAGNRHAESAPVVIIDLFSKDARDPLLEKVPEALDGTGVAWYLNSVQYETETGLYHWEWYVEVV